MIVLNSSIEESLLQGITFVGDAIWSYVMVAVLLGCAIWFTIRTRGAQFRMLKESVRLLGDTATTRDKSGKHVSSFQAFAVSIASRVGTGNLAGVATAIAMGGPGSIFWMWLIALFGAATSFVESTLAQLFKKPAEDSFIGGPAYYIVKGLKSRWMAALFAVLISITFGFSYNSIQSNTICDAMNVAFGIDKTVMGIVLTVMALAIVFGGIQRIARFSSIFVPLMAVGYLILAIYIICCHIGMLPQVLRLIINNAFGFDQAVGGGVGAAMSYGIKRGLFSNEAGEGSTPNIAATASVSHPVKQGIVQALGVFTDTLVVCSCTAFIILFSGVDWSSGLNGVALTQAALVSEVGPVGAVFIAVAIFMFAFSSIIGNYYSGEANIRYLTDSKAVLFVFRLLSAGVVVMLGAISGLNLLWALCDICMALLTAVNLIAIVQLGKYAYRLLDDYLAQRRAGVSNPEFHRGSMPELDLDSWE